MDAGVAEYWMVDPHERFIAVITKGEENATVNGELSWKPTGSSAPLVFDVQKLFG